MSSFRQILYHIVFRTKNSAKTLPLTESEELYRYIWGIIKNKNGSNISVEFLVWGNENALHSVRNASLGRNKIAPNTHCIP